MSKSPLLAASFRYKEQDPDYRGQELEERQADGPQKERTCTDVICCLLFLAMWAALFYVAYIGYSNGNPEYLIQPFDQSGHQCKYSPGYESYPYIYITNYIASPQSFTFVCVQACPTDSTAPLLCKSNSLATCEQLVVYASQLELTYCLPTVNPETIADYLIGVSGLQKYFADVAVGWPLILAMTGVALAISIITSVLIRYLAGPVVWFMIVVLFLLELLLGLIGILISDLVWLQELVHYNELPQFMRDVTYQRIAGGIGITLFAITLLVVCCFKKQIRISIGILKAAADFVQDCFSAFFLPIYTTILQVLFMMFWLSVLLFIFSSNGGHTPYVPKTPFAWVQWTTNVQYYSLFLIFCLFWVINFLSDLSTFWVDSTAAIWYFEAGQPTRPILRSLARSIYHIGSLAFGSLLIAIIMLIRVTLELVSQRLKQQTMGASETTAIKFLVKCASCLVACFERVIRFLTENAYIMMAISGEGFCSSAKSAFYLMLRSTAQFAVSHGTTKLFLYLGTTLIVLLNCLVGYFFISQISPYNSQIQSPVFLTVIFGLTALPIAWAFMDFFQKAANTILMCYCIQIDVNKKKSQCPQSLRKFLSEYVSSSSILRDQQE